MAITDQISAVQAKLSNGQVTQSLVDALYTTEIAAGGQIVNTAGAITIGGRSLTNVEYFRLGEALGLVW